jgi:hypothetical protein
MNHVAFIHFEPLSRVLSGIKKIECRLSVNRPACWNIEQNDTILFKLVGGAIVARARAKGVHKFNTLTPADVQALAELCAPLTGALATSAFWAMKARSKYAVIIELDSIERVEFPAQLTPKGVISGWVSDFQAAHHAKPIQ